MIRCSNLQYLGQLYPILFTWSCCIWSIKLAIKSSPPELLHQPFEVGHWSKDIVDSHNVSFKPARIFNELYCSVVIHGWSAPSGSIPAKSEYFQGLCEWLDLDKQVTITHEFDKSGLTLWRKLLWPLRFFNNFGFKILSSHFSSVVKWCQNPTGTHGRLLPCF